MLVRGWLSLTQEHKRLEQLHIESQQACRAGTGTKTCWSTQKLVTSCVCEVGSIMWQSRRDWLYLHLLVCPGQVRR